MKKGKASEKDKANALIFIHHHLLDSLKVQYLTIRDHLVLWTKLRKQFDHMKTVVVSQTQHAWQHLRLQDYKSVIDYNSTLFDITTRLGLCGVKIT